MKIYYDKRSYKWIPFKLVRTYVLVLLILSLFGPVKYEYDYYYAILMALYIITFLILTWIGMAKGSIYVPSYYGTDRRKQKLIMWIKLATIICLPIKIMLVVSSIQIMGMPDFGNVFSMLASVYTEMHHGESFTNVYRQIDTFCTMVFYFSTFAGVYWRKKLPKRYIYLIVLNVVLDLFYNLCFIGTQRSIITIAVLGLTILARNAIREDLKVDKKKLKKIVLIVIVLLIVFLNILSARKTLWNESTSYIYANNRFNLSHPLLFWCQTDKLKYDVCNLLSYFTQGFYGLSLAFQVPFEWSFMLGSVRGLNSIISQIFPFVPDMVELTYPLRAGAEFGVDGLASWYSIFPWLASDITFLGALLYMCIVAWLFMRCWIQSVEYDNPIAFSFLVLLMIQYIFLVANNQLFVQRGESLATVCLLLLYFVGGGARATSYQTRKSRYYMPTFAHMCKVAV